MKTIIGLVGVKTSGKSTVADIIKKVTDNAIESALADKLKEAASFTFNLKRAAFDDQRYKEVPFKVFNLKKTLTNSSIGSVLEFFNIYLDRREIDSMYDIIGMELKTPRHIAQIIGTEILRACGDEDIHCKNVKLNEKGITIISDVRFPNELEYFKNNPEFNFIPLYIAREVAENKVTPDSHISERLVFGMKEQCHVIDNNGPIAYTKDQVIAVLKTLNVINHNL